MSSDSDPVSADSSGPHSPDTTKANLALALCTVGFLLTFWAWALMGPLGATYKEELGLTSFQQSLVVALPVVVGSAPSAASRWARSPTGSAAAPCSRSWQR